MITTNFSIYLNKELKLNKNKKNKDFNKLNFINLLYTQYPSFNFCITEDDKELSSFLQYTRFFLRAPILIFFF